MKNAASHSAGDGDADQPLILCPACGYDLRQSAGRCPECGLQMDQTALRQSGFPWAHRKKIGTARAYLRTLWRVLRSSRDLANETIRPQELQDGRSFRWVTAGALGIALLSAWTWAISWGALEAIAYQPPMGGVFGSSGSFWIWDVIVPWSAGATLVWVMPLCLVLLAIYLTGVQQSVFHTGAFPQTYQRRTAVIAHYAAAPLALVLPGILLLLFAAACFHIRLAGGNGLGLAQLSLLVTTAGIICLLLALAGTLWHVGRWVRRSRHAGTGASVLAGIELLGLWLWGLILILGAIPWCVGLIFVLIDSFR